MSTLHGRFDIVPVDYLSPLHLKEGYDEHTWVGAGADWGRDSDLSACFLDWVGCNTARGGRVGSAAASSEKGRL